MEIAVRTSAWHGTCSQYRWQRPYIGHGVGSLKLCRPLMARRLAGPSSLLVDSSAAIPSRAWYLLRSDGSDGIILSSHGGGSRRSFGHDIEVTRHPEP